MWKYVAVGVWCFGVSISAVYLGSLYRSPGKPEAAAFPDLTEHHTVISDVVTIPVVRSEKIEGYVIAGIAMTANDRAFEGREYPPRIDVTDALVSYLQSGVPLPVDDRFELDSFRRDLVARMNERTGNEAFFSTLITRLNYLTSDEAARLQDPAQQAMSGVSLVDKALLYVPLQKGDENASGGEGG
ncbi:MAG: hypothetical protein J0H80_00255 [Rhizobiales bacterium]|nr:hypothetical protein [Hyphomicrobiales bacterium]